MAPDMEVIGAKRAITDLSSGIRLGEKTCGIFMKTICVTVEIELGDRDIVNYSVCSTPITDFFTTLPITDIKSLSKSTSQSSKKIPSVTKPFRQPLIDSTRNLPLHSNVYAYKPETQIQQYKSTTTIKNYYINAEKVIIN
ncbi:75_t:CDS:2 [Diversispora eburnea]|uniref:75_t:CDS:1 n=1 Tax=Diversispora eburnea TaxID=1213867 RepID=A0A9N9BRN1_9GLOM|nr:75_t:CDS:2 [Diversispora eburnea]